jgi:hypothetical protein
MLCHKIRKLLFIVHHNPYAVGACLCYHCFGFYFAQPGRYPVARASFADLFALRLNTSNPFHYGRRVTPPAPEAKEEEQFNSPDPQFLPD